MSGPRVVRALQRLGFERTGGRGSHVKLPKGSFVVVVPQHRELAAGTLRSVLEQAGIDEDTLLGAL